MRVNKLNTSQWITKELGIRYLQGVGLEIMLWKFHLQFLKEPK
jgi:hypothetical protein